MIPHRKAKLIFIGETKKPNTKSKKLSFSSSTNIQFTIWEQFCNLKHGEIDAIGSKVAQQIKLSGCPSKGHFTDKSGKNAFSCYIEDLANFSEDGAKGQSQKLSDIWPPLKSSQNLVTTLVHCVTML